MSLVGPTLGLSRCTHSARYQVQSGPRANPTQQARFMIRALILPETFQSIWRQGGVPCRVLDVAVVEVSLQRVGIDAVIRQLVAASVPQHVGVTLDAQIGRGGHRRHRSRQKEIAGGTAQARPGCGAPLGSASRARNG